MPSRFLRFVVVVLACLIAGCGRAPAALPNDAYIWQRVWTPAVSEAMRDSAVDIRAWRVLAAQTDRSGRLQMFRPDRQVLRESAKPVVLVVRIDGQLAAWDESRLLADTEALWTDWQASGVQLAGLEIDHDCGTARLPAYAHYLAALRPLLHGASLSITALPAWLHSPALENLLAQTDASVLQVHAVRDPHAGLFDGALALAWAREYAQRSAKPFWLALPDYGSRVSWDAQGQLVGVQSEGGMADDLDDSRELLAMPQQVADFLTQLRRAAPPGLAGIVWFRLPTAQDGRAWSMATWLAVLRGRPLDARVEASTRAGQAAGALDLLLDNPGELDAPLPARLILPPSCALADGVNGYALQRGHDTLIVERQQQGLLPAHRQRVIGWARCASDKVVPHVET